MTKNNPDISIIIPAYNSEKRIMQTINSCTNQKHQNIEIVIIDDKSSDNTVNIVEDIASSDPRIKLVKLEKNLGTFAARASGIHSARGDFVIFLDSDDKLLNDTTSLIFQLMQHNGADIVFFGIKNEGKKIRFSKPLPQSPLKGQEILKGFICDPPEPVWGIGGKAIKRSLLLESLDILDYVDKKFLFAEDALLCFVAATLSNKSLSINKNLYIYVENSDSITQNSSDFEKRDNQIKLALSYFQTLKNSKLTNHKYFDVALEKTLKILNTTKILNLRFQNGYVKTYFQAWLSYPRSKYLIIIFLYLISFGKFKR